jgi:hypothetical protein
MVSLSLFRPMPRQNLEICKDHFFHIFSIENLLVIPPFNDKWLAYEINHR